MKAIHYIKLAMLAICLIAAGDASAVERRDMVVRDSIEWTHTLPFAADRGGAVRVALFSPDQSRFVLHTRRGDVERNVNIHSLLLYDARAVKRAFSVSDQQRPQKSAVLATFETKRDDDAIGSVQWLSNVDLGFIAEALNGVREAFAVNVETRELTQLSFSNSDVVGFAASDRSLAYFACASKQADQSSIVVVDSFDQAVPGLRLREGCDPDAPVSLFGGVFDRVTRMPVPDMLLAPNLKRVWLSPDGTHAVVVVPAVETPPHWGEYSGVLGFRWGYAKAHQDPASWEVLGRTRYFLVDLKSAQAKPLLDAPTGQIAMNRTPIVAFWRSDGRSVIVSNTFLPLSGSTGSDRNRRSKHPAVVEVSVSSGEITPIVWEDAAEALQSRVPNRIVDFIWDSEGDRLTIIYEKANDLSIFREVYNKGTNGWRRSRNHLARDRRIEIREVQGLNERPKIYAEDMQSGRRALILDPNPRADALSFGRVSDYRWTDAEGNEWHGGLVVPPAYVPNKRYPLIVQTHGFNPNRFLLDGPNDGYGVGTGSAAQALANAGFMVLQVEDNRRAITDDAREGPAVAEGYRSGIAKLVNDGLVDASQVGLSAFSRTGLHALYLIHQHPCMISALAMSDTLHTGYTVFSFNVTRPAVVEDLARLGVSVPNFERMGEWFDRNPLYSLGRARPAVRLEAITQGLGMWEIFAVARQMKRPVELVIYPDGQHALRKPAERLSSQGGNVEWFRFWIQNYEDPDASKNEQYERWRRMRSSSSSIACERRSGT